MISMFQQGLWVKINCQLFINKTRKMKFIQWIKAGLLIVVLLTILAGCKEEVSNTGQLKVTFLKISTDTNVSISPVENPQVIIAKSLKIDINGTLTYELNPGNYILTVSASSFFPQVGFQIKPGQTTSIVYDVNNVVSVK